MELLFREVHRILQAHHYNALMVHADHGEDFGTQTLDFLGRLKSDKGILLAVCTSDYAEVTASGYSTFRELKFAHDCALDIIPLRVSDIYPPEPPHGPTHKYDKSGSGVALVTLALSPSKRFLDCRGKSAGDIAALIARRLLGDQHQAGWG